MSEESRDSILDEDVFKIERVTSDIDLVTIRLELTNVDGVIYRQIERNRRTSNDEIIRQFVCF